MNQLPPSQDPGDAVDDQYRRASAADPSHPSEAVRRAVLAHAARLAAERALRAGGGPKSLGRTVASQVWWRPAVFGTLAAAALAGLVIAPRYFISGAPPAANTPAAHALAARAPAATAPAATAPAATAPAANAPATGGAVPDAFTVSVAPAAPAPEPQAPAGAVYEPKSERRVASGTTDSSSDADRAQPKPAAARADAAAPVAGPVTPELQAKEQLRGAMGGRPAEQGRASADSYTARTAIASVTAARQLSAPAPEAHRPADAAAAFRHAAEAGDLVGLEGLLGKQSDIDARDSAGRTALMLATLHGQTNAVTALLAHGADPNAADARGTTPLQAARAGGQQAIIAALQRYGAR